jgi:DNA-binding CsgD family transcriptional regulator
VAAISTETRGARSSSARFREMIEPAGAADELRIAFRDAFGIWATLVVFTTRTMRPEDLDFASAAVHAGTAALRAATARAVLAPPAGLASRPADPGGPSVVLLDSGDAIIAADATSRARLSVLPETRDVTLPGIVSVLAAQARSAEAGVRTSARMRALDGRWLELDASALDEGSGSVAVVIQPAAPERIRDAVLRALGLSVRERQVALRSAQGKSAKEIARDLQISAWTVQDHLKAVYAKTGMNSRADLSALAAPPAGLAA